MARTDLSAMLERLPDDTEATTEPPVPTVPSTSDSGEKRQQRPTRRAQAQKLAPPTTAGYLDLERKEARLRTDQYAKLTEEARRLSRAKGRGGERITENTLIRVAIDLLLERADRLAGATEEELRRSVL